MRIIFTLAFISIPIALFAQNKSYIQIKSEPGVSVFLDNNFIGKTSSDVGGLIIEGVSPGNHVIKVLKKGFNPQEKRISINEGEVFTYQVKPFIPKVNIEQTGNSEDQQIDLQVGDLEIQSIPIEISIIIPKLGVNSSKNKDEWRAKDIPVGSYLAEFSWNGKIVKYSINIKKNNLTHLFINMIKGKIEDRSPQYTIKYGQFTDPRDGKSYKTAKYMTKNSNSF